MIGNDIVDLEIAAVESNWQRPGFLEKIFCEEEQESIFSARQPARQVWLLWSMKEAAYKAHQRKTNAARSFKPLSINCISCSAENTAASGIVLIGKDLYYLNSFLGNNYIHSIATLSENGAYISKVFPASVKLKERLIKKISEVKCLSAEKILFNKNTHFIPYVTYNEQVIDCHFSLSHHGNFASYSLALMNY